MTCCRSLLRKHHTLWVSSEYNVYHVECWRIWGHRRRQIFDPWRDHVINDANVIKSLMTQLHGSVFWSGIAAHVTWFSDAQKQTHTRTHVSHVYISQPQHIGGDISNHVWSTAPPARAAKRIDHTRRANNSDRASIELPGKKAWWGWGDPSLPRATTTATIRTTTHAPDTSWPGHDLWSQIICEFKFIRLFMLLANAISAVAIAHMHGTHRLEQLTTTHSHWSKRQMQ